MRNIRENKANFDDDDDDDGGDDDHVDNHDFYKG